MTTLFYPDTNAVVDAMVAACKNITLADGVTKAYVGTQKGEFKDLTDVLPCCEVYGNTESSDHHAFGGTVRDTQSFFVLSIADVTNSSTAETLIFSIRDAVMPYFQQHSTLSNAGNVWESRVKPNSGRYIRIFRNGKWYRAHVFELEVTQEYLLQGGVLN